MNRYAKLTKIFALTTGILLIIVVGLSVHTAGYGVELTKLELEYEQMLMDKVYLEEQIAKSISLKSAENLAKKYRYNKNFEILYLNDTDSFASVMDN